VGALAQPHVALRAIAVSAVVIFVAACGGERSYSGSAPAGSRAVRFRTEDGVRLAGRVFGPADASAGVVLAHMLPADQTSWYEEAVSLSDLGYEVLTFDFRGYCPGAPGGCSEGEKNVDATPVDLRAALGFLRSKGVSRVALVGASMGGTASLIVAAEEGDAVDAVVTLSAPQVIEGIGAGPDVSANVTGAKLFLAGLGDTTAAQALRDPSDGRPRDGPADREPGGSRALTPGGVAHAVPAG
jgi:pimeloyl-ACP methyl ester carboxylesterase